MDKFDIYNNIVFFAVIAAIAMIATGAVFFGATHQIVTIVICAMLLGVQSKNFMRAIGALKRR